MVDVKVTNGRPMPVIAQLCKRSSFLTTGSSGSSSSSTSEMGFGLPHAGLKVLYRLATVPAENAWNEDMP